MSSGVFFLTSKKDSKMSNGSIIQFDGQYYLVGCAHSFFGVDDYIINFLVNPSINGSKINSTLCFTNLTSPKFHPHDDDKHTHDISLFELNEDHSKLINENDILIYNLISNFKKPIKGEIYTLSGYNAGIASDPNFRGLIDKREFDLKYLGDSFVIKSSIDNLIKKTLNNHILKLEENIVLGSGYSGSSILEGDGISLIGVFFAETDQLNNELSYETKFVCALFAGADKVVQTINGKV